MTLSFNTLPQQRFESSRRWKNEKVESPLDRKRREAEMKKAEDKKRAEMESALNTEKLKNSKWTRDDLMTLVYKQEKILDTNIWNPQTFRDDLTLINEQLAKEKWVIKLGGIEKEKISWYGQDFLYGLLIQEHILNQGFYIEINEKNQPILHDNRVPERTQQLQGLQEQLNNLEFGVDRGNILRKNDNTSKIATYIAALAYHGAPEKNLIKYRENLEQKIKKDPNKILSVSEIQKSNLTPQQKSFLLAWRERKNDENLLKIQENQKKFVEHARESYNEKSADEHIRELGERPFSKSVELFAGGAIGIGLLLFAAYQLFGGKSGTFGKIIGVILGAIGLGMTIPMGDKTWKSLWGAEMVNSLTTKKPIDKVKAEDHPFAGAWDTIKEQWEKLWVWVKNLQARTSGPKEWTELVTRPEMEPATKEYPVGAMLYVLYEWSPAEQWKYTNYKANDVQSKAIKKTLDTLKTPGEKIAFRKLLETSWNRNMENHPELKDDIVQAKELKLPTIITSLETADSWLNYIPDWLGGTPKKVEALKIIAPKAKQWWEISLERLRKYFIEGKTGPANDKVISELVSGTEYDTIKSYVEWIDMKNQGLTLQQYLKIA